MNRSIVGGAIHVTETTRGEEPRTKLEKKELPNWSKERSPVGEANVDADWICWGPSRQGGRRCTSSCPPPASGPHPLGHLDRAAECWRASTAEELWRRGQPVLRHDAECWHREEEETNQRKSRGLTCHMWEMGLEKEK